MQRGEYFGLSKPFAKIAAGIFFAVYFGVSFFYLDKYPCANSDDATYSEPCANLAEHGRLNLSFLPPPGGFDQSSIVQHGRILCASRALIFKIFGVSLRTARLESLLAGMFLLLSAYALSMTLFENSSIALLTSVLLSLSHLFIFASHFARPDITVSLFLTGAVILYLKAEQSSSALIFFLAGLIAALTIDIHPSGNLALTVVGGTSLVQLLRGKISKKHFVFLGLGIAAGLVWWFGIRLWFNGELVQSQMKYNRIYGQVGSPLFLLLNEWKRWRNFFWLGAYHRNMFLLGIFAVGIASAALNRHRKGYSKLFLILFWILVGYTFGVPAKGWVYITYAYPFFALLSVAGLYDLFDSPPVSLKFASLGLSAALLMFLGLEVVHTLKFYRADYNAFISKIKERVPAGSTVLASASYWFGLRGHANLVASELIMHKMIMENNGIREEYFAGTNEDYFRRQGVEYVVGDEEIMQGTLFQRDYILPFVEQDCVQVSEFTDDFYNYSIFMSKRSPAPLVTKIFKVLPKKN